MSYVFLENGNVLFLQNGVPNSLDVLNQVVFAAPSSSERSGILVVVGGGGVLQEAGAQNDSFPNGNTGVNGITYPTTHYYSFIAISVSIIANALTNPLTSNRGDVEIARTSGGVTGTELLGVAFTSTNSQTNASISHGGGTTNPVEPIISRRFGIGPAVAGVAPVIKSFSTNTVSGTTPLALTIPPGTNSTDIILIILTSAINNAVTTMPSGFSLYTSSTFSSLTQEIITGAI